MKTRLNYWRKVQAIADTPAYWRHTRAKFKKSNPISASLQDTLAHIIKLYTGNPMPQILTTRTHPPILVLNEPFELEWITSCLMETDSNTAPGEDGVTAEVVKKADQQKL